MSSALDFRVHSSFPRGASDAWRRRGVHLRLLGGFELRCDGEVVVLPLPAGRLLAFVALRDRPLLRPYIAGALWPDATEARAAGNLRCAVWRLARCGARPLEATGSHLGLSPHVSFDVRLGTELARRLRDAAPLSDTELSTDNLSSDLLPDCTKSGSSLSVKPFASCGCTPWSRCASGSPRQAHSIWRSRRGLRRWRQTLCGRAPTGR